jgi:hypothetical protein
MRRNVSLKRVYELGQILRFIRFSGSETGFIGSGRNGVEILLLENNNKRRNFI